MNVHQLGWLLFLSSMYPLWRGWVGVRQTTLVWTMGWAMLAWAAWAACFAATAFPSLGLESYWLRYTALSLTGCTGVAVLGARRPIVTAWNWVVAGLVAVLLLPMAERLVIGSVTLDWLRLGFVAGTVGVLVVNYGPTRLGWSALLLALGCAWEFLLLLDGSVVKDWAAWPIGTLCLGWVPWVAWLTWYLSRPASLDLNQTWRTFRDRYGVVWSQRVREQFNRAAEHGGLSVRLVWGGLVDAEESGSDTARQILQALLKRFSSD